MIAFEQYGFHRIEVCHSVRNPSIRTRDAKGWNDFLGNQPGKVQSECRVLGL